MRDEKESLDGHNVPVVDSSNPDFNLKALNSVTPPKDKKPSIRKRLLGKKKNFKHFGF